MDFENFVGIDISKDTLDLALLAADGELVEFQFENDRDKIEDIFNNLFKKYPIAIENTLLCAEYTGHFGQKLIDISIKLNLNLWMESPYKILHSQGLVRGKSDKIDAQRIMLYAKRYVDNANLVKTSSKTVGILKKLIAERDLVIKHIATYKSQIKQEEGFLETKYFKEKKKRVNKLIKYNTGILMEIETEIDRQIKGDTEVKEYFENILSIDGIGKQTAIATIVATENFTKFENARQFACHAGCAPFKYESGSSKRSANKVSHKANKNLKRLFHMAAISTLRSNGEMKKYFDRKVKEGKNKMSVINAIRSKLIHRVFALAKQNRKYEKNYTHSLV